MPCLAPAWVHLGGILAHLGAILGPSWVHYGSFRRPWTLQNIDFPKVFLRFLLLGHLPLIFDSLTLSCAILSSSWALWCHLEVFLDPLGAILELSWVILGPPWAFPELPWGHLGAILVYLGASLGNHGASLAPLRVTLERSWAMVCPSWANLVTSGPLLERFLCFLSPCRGHLGAILVCGEVTCSPLGDILSCITPP